MLSEKGKRVMFVFGFMLFFTYAKLKNNVFFWFKLISMQLLSGLLGNEAGQDAIIRMYLYERRKKIVHPYNFSVEEFTNRISILRNKLGMCGIKDEGIVVPRELGPEGRTSTNVLSTNRDDLSYARTPAEILRILYESGDEHIPGGFYPKGANGQIARMYLKKLYQFLLFYCFNLFNKFIKALDACIMYY